MENDKLYPKLSEKGEKEAEAILQEFKEKMTEVAKDALSEFYISLSGYIESDSWHNFRNELLDGLKGYKNAKIQERHNFVKIRKQIFEENKKEIIKDINQDLLDEITSLKKSIEFLNECRRY